MISRLEEESGKDSMGSGFGFEREEEERDIRVGASNKRGRGGDEQRGMGIFGWLSCIRAVAVAVAAW